MKRIFVTRATCVAPRCADARLGPPAALVYLPWAGLPKEKESSSSSYILFTTTCYCLPATELMLLGCHFSEEAQQRKAIEVTNHDRLDVFRLQWSD